MHNLQKNAEMVKNYSTAFINYNQQQQKELEHQFWGDSEAYARRKPVKENGNYLRMNQRANY